MLNSGIRCTLHNQLLLHINGFNTPYTFLPVRDHTDDGTYGMLKQLMCNSRWLSNVQIMVSLKAFYSVHM
jgi:hypothetical protein